MELCFIVDASTAWLKYPLRRRGFLVFAPGEDYPADADDARILEWALKLGCVVVSADRFFEGKPSSVWIPPEWERRYNSWDLVTKVVKVAAEKLRQEKARP